MKNPPTFEDLYKEYHPLVRSIVRKYCSQNDVDDLVQEAFLNIWKGLSNFRGESSLKTWIGKIACHAAINHVRTEKRIPLKERLSESAPSVELPDITSHRLVRNALGGLSSDHRLALVLHSIGGYRVGDIALLLQVPTGTVKSRLFHAREKLVRLLKPVGGF